LFLDKENVIDSGIFIGVSFAGKQSVPGDLRNIKRKVEGGR
jgi:hypothetical protein